MDEPTLVFDIDLKAAYLIFLVDEGEYLSFEKDGQRFLLGFLLLSEALNWLQQNQSDRPFQTRYFNKEVIQGMADCAHCYFRVFYNVDPKWDGWEIVK